MATYAMPLLEIQGAGQDLARRTVCIKIQRSRLGNSKKVNSSQVEVDTDKTMINVSKRLFTSNEYAAIRNFDGEVTRYLESTCLPFERGIHLCPLPLLKQVERKMREFADERTSLVEAFIAVYPELCQHAPGQLRALHNPLDYRPVDEVRAAFDFSWRYVSFGVPDQLREISSQIWVIIDLPNPFMVCSEKRRGHELAPRGSGWIEPDPLARASTSIVSEVL